MQAERAAHVRPQPAAREAVRQVVANHDVRDGRACAVEDEHPATVAEDELTAGGDTIAQRQVGDDHRLVHRCTANQQYTVGERGGGDHGVARGDAQPDQGDGLVEGKALVVEPGWNLHQVTR